MVDRIDALGGSVQALSDRVQAAETRLRTVEEKLDLLSVSVDRRFDAVDEALLEQRQYTEFAFSRLETGFARMERKLDQFIDLHL